MHLYRLANHPLPSEGSEYTETVSPILQHVLDRLPLCPSFYADQRWNVLAWNKAACILLGDLANMTGRERNVVWAMFTSDYYKSLYDDWEKYAKSLLGRFRATCGMHVRIPWFAAFVEELRAVSPEFNQWWPLHEIIDDGGVYKHFHHPIAGGLDFESSCFCSRSKRAAPVCPCFRPNKTTRQRRCKRLARTMGYDIVENRTDLLPQKSNPA